MTRNEVTVNYVRSNELYDIFEVIDREGNKDYPRFPRSSHLTVADVLAIYAD